MPTRNTYYLSAPAFVADENSIVRRNGGIQIDWTNVSTDYENAAGKKVLPAGTPLGEALSTDGDKGSPRTASNPAVGLLESIAVEDDPNAPLSGYGLVIGGNVWENLLAPEFLSGTPGALDSDVKDELNAAGTGFAFQTFSDNRG